MNPQASANPWFQMIPFLLMFVIVYVMIIKPHKKEQAERKSKIAALKKNDSVITAGGVHGTVVSIKEKTVILRVDDNVRIEFDKEAISTVKPS